MGSRWYPLAVVVLWLSAMSWLVVTQVVPPMVVGKPPIYHQTGAADSEPEPPVGWNMSWNGRHLGWALSKATQVPGEGTVIWSRLHFDPLSLDQLFSAWPGILGPMRGLPSARLQLEADSTLRLDLLGHLIDFDSVLKIVPGHSLIRLRAAPDGSDLALSLRVQDAAYDLKVPLGPEGMLHDSFSPEMHLGGLRAGQRWTVPSYSPLNSITDPKHPIEILLARVEESTSIVWNKRSEEVWLVVYRTNEAVGPASDKNIRTKLWVHRDGKVLRQQIYTLGGSLVFNRMSDQDVSRLLETAIEGRNVRVPAAVPSGPMER
ncbi:MAG: hypothetical protein ABR915_08225 [Thermoguttaceae bacterium]